MKITRKEVPDYAQFPPSFSIKIEKTTNETGEVTGYKAFSKNYPEIAPAEAETQFHAVQGFHRRMRVYNSTQSAEQANSADVSSNAKNPIRS